MPETQIPVPNSPYGASKLAAEKAIGYQAALGAIGAVTLRTLNVAGAVDGHGDPDTSRIIPRALLVAAGQAARLDVNGDGSAIREFTHVCDLASAYAAALVTQPAPASTAFSTSAAESAQAYARCRRSGCRSRRRPAPR
ncbi:MAG: NAD-dependent epimerase/dehydratase family protein [Streptosporangiaceae bacterium]